MAIKLFRLRANLPIGVVKDAKGNVIGKVYPDDNFVRNFNENCDRIEEETGALEAANAAEASAVIAQGAAATAQAAAGSAASAASDAQDTADAIADTSALQNSFVDGATTIDGIAVSGNIDISAHTRMYNDAAGTTVAVNAGTVVGFAVDTLAYIYYDDPGRIGGAVTYHATTDAATAGQATPAHPDRHFVGYIKTPTGPAGTDTVGAPNAAPPQVTNEFIAGQLAY